MALFAIDRHVFRTVALNAVAHIQIYFVFGGGLRGHIAVAGGALHPRANVRCVIELHMSRLIVAVHAYPGNFFATLRISSDLLDLGLVGIDYLVAGHAERYAWNTRIRPSIHTSVASITLHPVREMDLVRIGNGLRWVSWMEIQKICYRRCGRGVRRREHTGA